MLHPRIVELKSELKTLQSAHTRLSSIKYSCELQLTEIKKVSSTASGLRTEKKELSDEDLIKNFNTKFDSLDDAAQQRILKKLGVK